MNNKNVPLLEIKNLNIMFKNESIDNYSDFDDHDTHKTKEENKYKKVVSDLSMVINQGETVALIGESGSGKSLTALSSIALLPPQAIVKGSFAFFDENENKLKSLSYDDQKKLRGIKVSMIFQEPMTSLNPVHRIGKQISEIIEIHNPELSNHQINEKTLSLLQKVGIKDEKNKINAYPHELSGGQRQRVMIAMAIANKPKLIIADEPTTALDVTIEKQILELLQTIKAETNTSILFITHNLSIVKKMADRIYVMKNGNIIEEGNVSQIFNSPKEEYTKKLINSEITSIMPEFTYDGAKEILNVDNLKVHFPIKSGLLRKITGYVKAVNDVSFNIHEGETLGVVGESGSGKTTLGLAILKLINSTGKIIFQSNDINSLSKSDLRKFRSKMQIVFQDPYGSLSPRMSIAEIIREGLDVHFRNISQDEKMEIVLKALDDCGMNRNMANRYPHEFSGGQRQRIAIARAIVLRPSLIIMDEPTSALDLSVQAQIIELLKKLQKEYKLSYIFISHDLKVVRALAHKMIILKDGNIIEHGTNNKIFNNPQNAYTKELISAALG